MQMQSIRLNSENSDDADIAKIILNEAISIVALRLKSRKTKGEERKKLKKIFESMELEHRNFNEYKGESRSILFDKIVNQYQPIVNDYWSALQATSKTQISPKIKS
jgi:hypothetical protein